MAGFIGGSLGDVFNLLNLIPDDLVVSQSYVSSDGGEILYLSPAPGTAGRFISTATYVVNFVKDGSSYVSPFTKLYKTQRLGVAVPRLALGTYDIEVSYQALDSAEIESAVKVLPRGYIKGTHSLRSGLLSSWKIGPQSTSQEENSLTSFDSNFALISAATGELLDEMTFTKYGHTVAAETQPRGFNTLLVRSVYPFVSEIPGLFSIGKGTTYNYTGLDTDTNEIQGISILKGEDRGISEGTAIWPIVV